MKYRIISYKYINTLSVLSVVIHYDTVQSSGLVRRDVDVHCIYLVV